MKNTIISTLSTLVIAVALTGQYAYSQGVMKTTQLNVFKNGTYYVVKEGNIQIRQGKAKLEIPRSPLMGTFWLTTAKDMAVSKIVFMTDTLKTSRIARVFPDLLKANKGKRLKLTYRLDEKTYADLSGTLLDYFPNGIAKIKTIDGKTVYLQSGDLKQLSFDDNPAETLTADSMAYLANVEFSKNYSSTPLKMVYMHTGIQWIPSYNIKILDDNELQLEMRALVENFNEVVDDAELTLTVGDPQFKFGRNVEPFAIYGLSNIFGTAATMTNQYMFQNVAAAPSSADRGMTLEGVQPDYNDYNVYQAEGQKTNDLYMYRLGKVSIPKNSKASFQVFSQKVPYKDVYDVKIGDIVNYSGSNGIYNDPETRFDVFHSFKLTNTTKNPFTTAPVFVLDKDLNPLAQDEIKYTPAGGNVPVELSRAADVIVKNAEEEINRVDRARTIDKYTYSKVTIRGKVRIENLQDKKIVLNLQKHVNAEVTVASDGGIIKKQGKYSGLNPYSLVSWELPLEANEKKEVSYEYEVYVLSRP